MASISDLQKQFAKETPIQRPNMNELAASDSMLYSKHNVLPYNPDTLVSRKGLEVYDKMRLDDMVKASLTLKKFATLAPNYKLLPADGSKKAEEIALAVSKAFQHVGLLAVELFLTKDGEIWVNEVAPRPHNSGHYSIEASYTSQFEQHIGISEYFPVRFRIFPNF